MSYKTKSKYMITTVTTQEEKPDWLLKKEQRRKKLIELSNAAREIRDDEDLEEATINDIIIERFYTDERNTEFHTFKDWKEKGYFVKKGSEAYIIWGKKRKVSKASENEEDKDDEYKFYPLAYLFSNEQVKAKENE